ncbi:DUF2778 domain-containing protein [Paraburkholderia sp. Ac-20336]|uniref:DUF2778 domain-containing protein n=1 Tax=Burkholderiaceae TaxID=119060 RepID=UPI0019643D2C|nr:MULTISPECIES: DUF2778 domain-containing protein [Burkholderiaceae]MBN3804682.1 DUF2778 domain-containing protein [Paraburkholderia sp. Ac-20336]NIF53154.1 DUF2778 domain-containing protein [Burkholderia sp. Ax-1724]
MSTLSCAGVGNFSVFSGDKAGKDNPAYIAVPNVGLLPPGRYYIVDRGSGGIFTHLRDFFLQHLYGTDRSKWFGLYKDDGEIDDRTFVNGIARGNFRLHPRGPQNLSEGCITLDDPVGFERLRARLLATSRIAVPGGKGFAYGTVDVQ